MHDTPNLGAFALALLFIVSVCLVVGALLSDFLCGDFREDLDEANDGKDPLL